MTRLIALFVGVMVSIVLWMETLCRIDEWRTRR